MKRTSKDLAEMQKITKDIIKTAVNADEHAVAEYVRSVCEQMSAVGEDLRQYNLVRTSGFSPEGMVVQYSIEKKEHRDEN